MEEKRGKTQVCSYTFWTPAKEKQNHFLAPNLCTYGNSQERIIKRREEERETIVFCETGRIFRLYEIVIVAEDIQGLLCTPLSPLPVEKELPWNSKIIKRHL